MVFKLSPWWMMSWLEKNCNFTSFYLLFAESVFLNKVSKIWYSTLIFYPFLLCQYKYASINSQAFFGHFPNSLGHSGHNKTVTFWTTFMIFGSVLYFICYLIVRLMYQLCLKDYSYKVTRRVSCKNFSLTENHSVFFS